MIKIRGCRWVFAYAFLLALAMISLADASCPLLTHSDADNEREFQNVCQTIQNPSIQAATISTATITNLKFVRISSGPFSNWTVYSPTIGGAGTISAGGFWWRRIGDTLEVMGAFKTGTVQATTAYATLPSPYIINMSSLPGSSTALIGDWAFMETAATLNAVYSDASTTDRVFFTNNATAGAGFNTRTGAQIWNTGDFVSFKFSVPVSGWSF